MRLHRLVIEAFGPYAERQEVDFDQLHQAGVFLLTGPTGAGKTSVLDAVCFALYGVVPGDREVRSLRSAHAGPELCTQVELELTVGGRRLRVTRWPEWERPKKRGDGTTPQRAGARLLEIHPTGEERLISARAQEVGHELAPLLSMSSDQFMQVVLLPQGGFAAFLTATSEQRRDLLERLFATQRFTRIEGWVHDRATSLRARSEELRSQLLQLVAAMAHRAETPPPSHLGDEELGSWRRQVRSVADAAFTVAAQHEAESHDHLESREAHTQRVLEAHQLAGRRLTAQATLRDLADADDQAADDETRLAAHRQAAAVTPLLPPLVAATDLRESLLRRVDHLTGALPAPIDLTRCRAEAAEAQRWLGTLTALGPTVARRDEARARQLSLSEQVALAQADLAVQQAEQASFPTRRAAIASRLVEARRHADRVEELREAEHHAQQRLRAQEDLGPARTALRAAEQADVIAHDQLNLARAHHLDLVEQRLAGMAAELAGDLSAGDPCAVCGSEVHPSPATALSDAVTLEQQQQAERAVQDAVRRREETERALHEHRRAVTRLERVVPDSSLEDARRDMEVVEAELAYAVEAQAAVAALELEHDGLERTVREAEARVETARNEQQTAQARLEEVRDLLAELDPQLGAVLGELSHEQAQRDAHDRCESLATIGQALQQLDEAQASERRCRDSAEDAATAAGFLDLSHAREARLDPTEAERIERAAAQRERSRAAALATLSSEEIRSLDELEFAMDADAVSAAREELRDATVAHRRAHSALDGARAALAALDSLDVQIEAACDEWRPVRDRHETAESLATLVRGTSADNQLQVRLSSYVLMTQLDLVLEAANERLHQMRDNRYSVRRVMRGTRSRGRTGLDLEMMDEWTGQVRSPSTLSGGETFKVSLALALGLADVISHESGGTDIETLFIDEGFAMLDPDTLDEVMDCIDDLRGGGRSVGVVSHVTELMSRIGTQLHVEPGRQGSRVRVATAVA